MWYRDEIVFLLRWCHVGWFAVSSCTLRNVRVSVHAKRNLPVFFFFSKCESGPKVFTLTHRVRNEIHHDVFAEVPGKKNAQDERTLEYLMVVCLIVLSVFLCADSVLFRCLVRLVSYPPVTAVMTIFLCLRATGVRPP